MQLLMVIQVKIGMSDVEESGGNFYYGTLCS